MKQDNIIVIKTKAFALRIIKLYNYLCSEKNEYVMSKQLLKCGTSIGANVREAIRGQSRSDFYAKLHIALKEASECEYWWNYFTKVGILLPSIMRVYTRIVKR